MSARGTSPAPAQRRDFLAYSLEVEGYYKLTNGELVETPSESDENLYRAMRFCEALNLDPVVSQVTVLRLTSQGYSETTFAGEGVVESPSFPVWTQTAAAIRALE